jgi:hypothetical protein
MRVLHCVLARLSDVVARPDLGVADPAEVLRAIFAEASGHRIELRVDATRLETPLEAGTAAHYSLDLHHAVRQLTQNPLDAETVDRVAVLYGARYAHFPGIFGVMFDRGFLPDTLDDVATNPKLIGRPREGCAIFLDAIAQYRSDASDRARQVRFTTVHEMGHLFNLLHIGSPQNFLTPSAIKKTYDEGAFQFNNAHKEQLAEAEHNPSYWPGGSNFADLGSEAASHDRLWSRRKHVDPASLRGGLTLRLAIARERFRYFEPVELDISVRLPRSAPRSRRLPDMLDPGYEQLRVWIEDPTGERRRYRSPRYYCPHDLYRTLKPGEMFRRDVSIFGQSGGYTFRRAGEHRLWAEFALDARTRLRSNTVTIEVEPSRGSKVPAGAAQALKRISTAELLYHRLDRREGAGARTLEALITAFPRMASIATLRYALARTYAAAADPALHGRAREHLTRAIDSVSLGEHQREKAMAALQSRDC